MSRIEDGVIVFGVMSPVAIVVLITRNKIRLRNKKTIIPDNDISFLKLSAFRPGKCFNLSWWNVISKTLGPIRTAHSRSCHSHNTSSENH